MLLGFAALVYFEIKKSASDDPKDWEHAIVAFEQSAAKGEPENAVLFIGSSSIRLWDSLKADMAPIPVIQRGFGGAKLLDVAYYTERLIKAKSPKAIVVFAGTNDIHPGRVKPADILLDTWRSFVGKTRAQLPGIPIYYIAITPTPLRWEVWPEAQATNKAIREWNESQANVHFINTVPAILGTDGKLVKDRYIYENSFWGGLHLSQKGYDIWVREIRPLLLAYYQ